MELKRMASEEVLRELPTDIAAVANARGGAIILGVTDDKELVGCDPGGEVPTAGADRLRDVFSPDGKRFLVVLVPEAGTLPHSDHHDKFPIRVGNVTAHLDASGVV